MRHWWWMPEMSKPLVNDRLFREELERLEREGAQAPPEEVVQDDQGIYPPSSGQRLIKKQIMLPVEVDRLRQLVRKAGYELINDGACYRVKRSRDFMIWTLETSPLASEEAGGDEPNALWEIVTKFNLDLGRKS